MSTGLKTQDIDLTQQTYGIVSHDQRIHSPNMLQCTSPVVALSVTSLRRTITTLLGHEIELVFSDERPIVASLL